MGLLCFPDPARHHPRFAGLRLRFSLYSGHIARLSLTLELTMFSMISGKWKVPVAYFTPEVPTRYFSVFRNNHPVKSSRFR